MAIEWVILVGVVSLIVGFSASLFFARTGRQQKNRARELEGQLQAAQDELSDYKREVFDQFSDTADKFRELDRSYQALHRQLAESSVALCGDQATPLLGHSGGGEELIGEVAPAPSEAEATSEAEASSDAVASEEISGVEEALPEEEVVSVDTEDSVALAEGLSDADKQAADTAVHIEEVVVPEAEQSADAPPVADVTEEVPTLTDEPEGKAPDKREAAR